MPNSKKIEKKAISSASVEKQLATFIDKFTPEHAGIIRGCRAELRKMFPTANEIVYDNYNFFVIGYSPTLRPSDTIVSLAAAANGVGLSFYYGANLPDPDGLLLGSGSQNRFIRLPKTEVLREAGIRKLIKSAVEQSDPPSPKSGGGETIIKSISARQRPRRKLEKAE